LLVCYIALNRMADARAELTRALKMGLDKSTEDLSIHLAAHFLFGEQSEVQRVMTQVAGRPDEFLATQALAGTQYFSGQYRQASATMMRAFDQAGRAKAPDVQAALLLTDLDARGYAGLCDGDDTVLRRAQALDKSKQTEEWFLLAASVCGQAKLALPVAQGLAKKYPEDTLIQNVYVPLTKAFLALAAGHPQEAIEDAEPAKPWDLTYPASYVQGLAYLQMHDASHAKTAFESSVLSPGAFLISFTPSFYAQGQLGLARAYAMAGDKDNAKKAYNALFATWKDAEADLPMLIAAKKEYAGL
jgi:tetratricopeptide (TPR) repeat protein